MFSGGRGSVIDIESNKEMAKMLLYLKDEARDTFFSDCIKHFCEDHELSKHNSDMWESEDIKKANHDRFWATYRCTVKKQPSDCPVDGGWTQWSEWDICSLTCGPGLQHRRRTCSNPLPQNGGYPCDGLAIDTLRCEERPCPEKVCAAVLLEGTPVNEALLPTMTVYSMIDGESNGLPVFASKPNTICKGPCYLFSVLHGDEDKGLWCFGFKVGEMKCFFIGQGPIGQLPANITVMREFVEGGFRKNPDMNVICKAYKGLHEKQAHHQRHASSVQAAKDRLNEVHAVHPQLEQLCVFAKCSYDQVTHLLPNKHEIVMDGQWSEWGPWSACSVKCGQGSTVRQRNCTDPAPQNGGWRCRGQPVEIKQCTRNDECTSDCDGVLLEGTPIRLAVAAIMTVYSMIEETSNNLPAFASKPNSVCTGPCYLYSLKKPQIEEKGGSVWCFGLKVGENTCLIVGYGPFRQHPTKINVMFESVNGEFTKNPDLKVSCYYVCAALVLEGTPVDKTLLPAFTMYSMTEETSNNLPAFVSKPNKECGGKCYLYSMKHTYLEDRGRQQWCFGYKVGVAQCFLVAFGPLGQHPAKIDRISETQDNEWRDNPNLNVFCNDDAKEWMYTWSPWGQCQGEPYCSIGTRQREMTCPKAVEGCPQNQAEGDVVATAEELCTLPPCQVDGGWSGWSEWSVSTSDCGEGKQGRFRTCNHPAPQAHGKDCPGPRLLVRAVNVPCEEEGARHKRETKEVQDLMDEEQSIDDNHKQQSIDENVVQGQQSVAEKVVQGPSSVPRDEDYVQSEAYGDHDFQHTSHGDIAGPEVEGEVIAELTDEESKTTSEGMLVLPSFLEKAGEQSEDMAYLSNWGKWTTCSRSCEDGIRKRQRDCLWKERRCRGDIRDVQLCNIQPCPVHGGFSDWSDWTECSLTCGEGTTSRNRVCANPAPRHGGQMCEGPDREEKACQKSECPNSGEDHKWQWQSWESWQPCDRTCDMGYRQRKRGCMTKPGVTQLFIDTNLNCKGRRVEVMECQVAECAENGNWAGWLSWSGCTATCGEGVRSRDRTCSDPAPSGDGKECEGQGTEVEHCSIPPCIETDGTTRIFSKDSYLMYPAPTHPAHVWRAFVRFFPYTGDGLLLWTSSEKEREEDDVMIELGLKEGLIVFKVVLGKDEVDVLGDEPKIDAWNDVVATIAGERASLRVNDGEIREKLFSVEHPGASFGGQLFLGGALAYSTDSFFKTGLQGKVCDLWLNYQQFSLKEYPWKGDRIPVEGHNSADEKTDLVAASLLFSGEEYAEIPVTTPKAAEGSFTISMVLMPSEGEGLLLFNKGTERSTYIILLLSNNRVVLKLGLDGEDIQTSSEELKLKRWMHLQLMITKRGDAEMRINSGPATQLSCEGMQYQPGPSLMIGGVTEKLWKDLTKISMSRRRGAHYSEIVASDDSSLKLRCDYSFIEGKNLTKPHVIWMKEDRRQQEGEFVSITKEEPDNKYVTTLHLRDLHSSMTGSYSCLVVHGGRAFVTHAYGILVETSVLATGKMTATEEDNLVLEVILLVLLVPFLVVICVCCAARIRCCQER
ncbi:hypothetical protein Bbelb_297370 [Branchiostoma belcheri]|nr:hypothetical protein Bbelb_297370 [Branchiostoma belcheri]